MNRKNSAGMMKLLLNRAISGSVTACEGVKFHEPANWNPVNEIVTYLETLFDSSENVGYVTETWEKNDNGKVKYSAYTRAVVTVRQVSLLPPSTIVTVIYQMYSVITNPRQGRG